MHIILRRNNPPADLTHPFFGHHKHGLSSGAIAAIVLAVLIVVGILAWVALTFLRHRRLGLPRPTWRTFIPFMSSSRGDYEPTRPVNSGGLFSFLKPGNRHGVGGYTGTHERSMRTRDAVSDNAAWDPRMDEEELEYRGAPAGVKKAVIGALPMRGREQDLSVGREEERGRSRNRGAEMYVPEQLHHEQDIGAYSGAASAGPNPFEADVHRQQQRGGDGFGNAVKVQGGRMSVESKRKSAFREDM